MKPDFVAGATLLFDKPYSWTSFDLVNAVRYVVKRVTGLKKIKVGHAGTLDPLATGLLIVCTGRMTKRIDEYQALEKEYTGTFFLGATTPTCDLESQPDRFFEVSGITAEMIYNAADRFQGEIQQTPPVFSAIKVEGKRAYEYARENEDVQMVPKTIFIHNFEITQIALPEIRFRVVCSKGTYIRALARDFGIWLGCGAYLSQLRRTRIGDYNVAEALDIQEFKASMLQDKTVSTAPTGDPRQT